MKLNTAKKLTAGALALSMMFAMATPAFALREAPNGGMSEITITKNYKLTNPETVSPEEEFHFTIEPDVATTDVPEWVTEEGFIPVPEIGTVKFYKGEAGRAGDMSKKVKIKLPDNYRSVGVYSYIIKETAGNTAGVTYYGKDIVLKVTVIEQDGKTRVAAVHTEDPVNGKYDTEKGDGSRKKDDFDNTYSAGDLYVTKTVDGNLGDKRKDFDFSVVFKKEAGKDFNSTVTASVAGLEKEDFTIVWDDKGEFKYDFALADGQTAHFDNLPYGVTYKVTEAAYDDYTTEKTGDTGSISAAVQTAAFTNTKDGEVDTGVILDNAPYILMLAVVAGGAMTLVIKKRREEE